jgi:hypothetical protein
MNERMSKLKACRLERRNKTYIFMCIENSEESTKKTTARSQNTKKVWKNQLHF